MNHIDAKNMRKCKYCEEYKPIDEFFSGKGYSKYRCKECHRRKWQQAYRKKATQLGRPPMPEILKPEYWGKLNGLKNKA